MERASGEDEIADMNAAPVAGSPTIPKRKRTRKRRRPAATDGAASSAAAICGDTVGAILARLPARTAIACTALSKRHRSLIHSPEFRILHCRHGASLPHPHVAYLAMAPIRRTPENDRPNSGYYGFHLAGSGPGLTGSGNAPIRSVAGWRYLGTKYVNTCNGVLLLATKGFADQCVCTLWNPAIDDTTREVTISESPSSEETSARIFKPDGKKLWNKETQFLALGLGYGLRSNTYKLLLCRWDRSQIQSTFYHRHGKLVGCSSGRQQYHIEYSLVVYQPLGSNTANKETLPLRTVLSLETVQSYDGEVDKGIIKQKSLYMDGTIYFLYLKNHDILAFDVDKETMHTIEMPGKHQEADAPHCVHTNLQLIQMSGRPCLVIAEKDCVALWLITVNYKLEQMHVISYEMIRGSGFYKHKIVSIWDCGGILCLWFNCPSIDKLLLYDVTAKKIFRADLPCDLTVLKSNYMLCWGYKPTLVSPESIAVEFKQDVEQRRGLSAHINAVINPLFLQDRRKGQEATLNIVCLMEFLVRIMQKLPQGLPDVVEMLKMD